MNCPKCQAEMIKGRKGFMCEECGERVSSTSGDIPTQLADVPSLVGENTILDEVSSLQNGRYSIIETLGKGGMGIVYRALDTRLKRNVAIKGMLPELMGQDRSEQRFMREAQAIASIDHPGVIRVFDYFPENNAYYMVMEYFQAMSLSEYVSHLPNAKEHDFTPIFTQIIDALAVVHQKGQVHRDLKPSNVLINNKEQIKLIDFGLVKGGGSLVSVSGKYLGTPGYTAPEQEIDSAMADARSDIYSMGGLMYFCSSGGKHPPRVVFPASVPEKYRVQILTCLTETQSERYQNTGEIRRALSTATPSHRSSEQGIPSPLNLGSESIAASSGGLSTGFTKPPQTGEVQTFDGIDFVYCPAGTFMMGSKDYDDEQPVHEVEISRGFWLGKYPVTQGQWLAVMGNNPSEFKRGDGYPVECVSWEDSREFIDRLNEIAGAEHCRLPTEAEWEYACRAGSTTAYCFGDDELKLKEYAWFGEDSAHSTHPVGKKRPNDWGLYDMHGNVWEWVLDWYDSDYYKNSPGADPLNTRVASSRVYRGGCWRNIPGGVRSAHRTGLSPGRRIDDLGFRLLRVAGP
jgi:formylglycine-generating enzyme required for sulfatase activity